MPTSRFLPTHARTAFGWTLCLLFASMACNKQEDNSAKSSSRSDAGREERLVTGNTASPRLVAVDSVMLQEHDTTYLGRPSGLALAPDGTFFVADLLGARVLHYNNKGELLGIMGRKGTGPGEFSSPSWMALAGDSVLLVKDNTPRRVVAFDVRTHTFRWGRQFADFTTSVHRDDERFVLARLHPASTHSGLRFGGPDDVPEDVGPLPVLYRKNHVLPQVFFAAEAVSIRDTIVGVFEVSDYLYWSDRAATFIDSVAIPVIRRKGARLDLISAVTADPNTVAPAVYQSSQPWEIAQLPSGRIAVVHYDPERVNNRMTGTLYLSLVDRANRTACADAHVPGSEDPQPFVAFRGDTLAVLSQHLRESGKPETMLVRFLVHADGCG